MEIWDTIEPYKKEYDRILGPISDPGSDLRLDLYSAKPEDRVLLLVDLKPGEGMKLWDLTLRIMEYLDQLFIAGIRELTLAVNADVVGRVFLNKNTAEQLGYLCHTKETNQHLQCMRMLENYVCRRSREENLTVKLVHVLEWKDGSNAARILE